MNILIIDPKDNPLDHKLIEMEWDLIIDLAWSTPDFIELLSSKHSCRVIQIDQYFNNQETLIEMATIKQSLLGKVVDSHGINWSDILAPYISTITKNIMRVYQLNKMIDKNDEIFFTRENLVYKFLKRKKMYILKKSYAQNPVSKFLYSIKSFFIGIRNLDLIQFIWVLANRLDPFFSVRSVIFRKRIINNPQMILAPIPFINVGNLIHKIAKYNHDFNFTFIYEGLFFNQSHIGQNINNSFIYAYIPKRQEITNESYELKKQLVNHALKYLSEKEINREAVLDGLESSFQNLSQGLLLREAIVKIIKKYKPHAVLSGDENNMFGRISIIWVKNSE